MPVYLKEEPDKRDDHIELPEARDLASATDKIAIARQRMNVEERHRFDAQMLRIQ